MPTFINPRINIGLMLTDSHFLKTIRYRSDSRSLGFFGVWVHVEIVIRWLNKTHSNLIEIAAPMQIIAMPQMKNIRLNKSSKYFNTFAIFVSPMILQLIDHSLGLLLYFLCFFKNSALKFKRKRTYKEEHSQHASGLFEISSRTMVQSRHNCTTLLSQ